MNAVLSIDDIPQTELVGRRVLVRIEAKNDGLGRIHYPPSLFSRNSVRVLSSLPINNWTISDRF